MKLLQKLVAFAMLSLALAVAAHAQVTPTVVRITGSTAYRGATHNAIKNILGAGVTYGYVGTSFTGAGQAIFTGSVGGNPIVVKTSWSGSVGGVQTVSQGKTVVFLPDNTPQSGTGANNATTATDTNGGEVAIPDVAMSDTFQNATPFNATPLVDTKVGIVPFQWVASNGAPAGLTNVTPQLAKALFANGSTALSLFTGAAGDQGIKVFAVGRDPDSGTRLTAFAETGVGVAATVVQYQPTISGGVVTSQIPWPAADVNQIHYEIGNSGYPSGSALAATMTATTFANLNGYYVTYLSTGDAATAITGGAKELSYNGVTYSTNPAALQQGRYTFWSYEHLMYRSDLANAKKTVAQTLATQLINVDATVLLGSMKVERLSDGGPVRQNF